MSSKFGLLSDDTFDVLVFDNEQDYNCYIESSTMYLAHGYSSECDFIYKEGVVYETREEWSSSDSLFLSKDKTHNDILVVLDNTAFLDQFINRIPKQVFRDVTYEMSITTVFEANDFYNKTFLFFMSTLGGLFAFILVMACIYRTQKRAHSQVMQTK